MRFVVVSSKKDLAGMNIVSELENLNFKDKIDLVDCEIIYAEGIDKELDCDFIIFASKHQSEKKVKTLTVHAPGNWGKADFGGQEGLVCNTSAFVLKKFFQELNKQAKDLKDEYLVSLEATHHGPLVNKPCLFIEVGSSEEEWGDLRACKVVAQTIAKCVGRFKEGGKYKVAAGVGGPHYCPNFNQIQFGEKFALGHIIAEYSLPIDEKMISEAIEKTKEKVDCFIIDWKGLGNAEQRSQAMGVLEGLGLEIIRTRDAKENI